MSEAATTVLSEARAEELRRLAEERGVSQSAILRAALEEFFQKAEEVIPSFNLETEAEESGPGQSDKEYIEQLRDLIVDTYDFIPPILARGETGPVTTSFPKDMLRMMDVLLGMPAIRQKTRSDLVRALCFFALSAIDRMKNIEHPSWRMALILGKHRVQYERQLAVAEDLYSGARALVDSLNACLAADRIDQAIALWVGYYDDAQSIPSETQRGLMLQALARSPYAGKVAWLGRNTGLIPDEFVPDEEPETRDTDPDRGLPTPPHVVSRRLARTQSFRGGEDQDA